MVKNKFISWVAKVSAVCLAFVAVVTSASACTFYFYQPKTPANLRERLANKA